jgi:membrane associated rhomboid family serine protease
MDTPRTSAAAAIGIPLGVIVAWLLGVLGLDVSPEVAAAFGGFFSAVLTLVVKEKP